MAKIPLYTSKTAPSDNDLLILEDSVSNSTKKITEVTMCFASINKTQ